MLNSSIDCILSQEQMQIKAHMGHGTMSNCVEEDGSKEDKVGGFLQAKIVLFILVFLVIIVMIVTRPKPAYGRQGLAGSWGQVTDD